jgi:hypothetical protein
MCGRSGPSGSAGQSLSLAGPCAWAGPLWSRPDRASGAVRWAVRSRGPAVRSRFYRDQVRSQPVHARPRAPACGRADRSGVCRRAGGPQLTRGRRRVAGSAATGRGPLAGWELAADRRALTTDRALSADRRDLTTDRAPDDRATRRVRWHPTPVQARPRCGGSDPTSWSSSAFLRSATGPWPAGTRRRARRGRPHVALAHETPPETGGNTATSSSTVTGSSP